MHLPHLPLALMMTLFLTACTTPEKDGGEPFTMDGATPENDIREGNFQDAGVLPHDIGYAPPDLASPGEDSAIFNDADPDDPILWVDAEMDSQVGTVFLVRWQTSSAVRGRVSFGLPGKPRTLTPLEPEPVTIHEALLLGMKASRTYEFQILSGAGAHPHESGPVEIKTEALPPELPPLTLTASAEGGGEGFTLIPVFANEGGGLGSSTIIVDRDGAPVWWFPEAGFRVALARDRAGIVYIRPAMNPNEDGSIVRAPFDTRDPETDVFAPAIHTDFVELPDGTIGVLTYEDREFEDGTRLLRGDAITEISPDGNISRLWGTFDALEPNLNIQWPPVGENVEQWLHVNGISFSDEENAYYVTSRFPSMVFKIHRSEGLEWVLSEPSEEFDIEEPGLHFNMLHSVQRIDGGLLLFNTESPQVCSEALEVAMDGTSVSRVWSYETEDCVAVTTLGNAQRLAGGNTLLVLSTAGQIDEASSDGDLLWRLNSALGVDFGFAQRIDSLY